MNLYSNKQKWKIALLILALLTVGASLFVSNQIVSKVGDREKERAQQWADAIRKKIELVRLTNNTFDSLRAKEREKMALWVEATEEASKKSPLDVDFSNNFPLRITQNNTDIPVIAVDGDGYISANRNLDFDTSDLRKIYPKADKRELMTHFDDSLLVLSETWKKKNPSFTVEVFDDFYITYCYNDSRTIDSLENVRDSLIESFNRELIDNEGLVPVLLIDAKSLEIMGTNIPEAKNSKNASTEVTNELRNQPIIIDFQTGEKNLLYYGDSPELKQLKYFPFIQFTVIGLFAFIGYLIFSTFRKAEQNQVWAGMAKETAHQLGTPLSSLMAWVQYLETQGTDEMITTEMQKDVNRLEKVTDRFSKIGSGAKLDSGDVAETVRNVMSYMKPRISDKVDISIEANQELLVKHNASLIEWVVENIAKNAVDAMEGEGSLFVTTKEDENWVHIDIRDTGKGIHPNQLKTIFQPGFSTKKRGWGLGLSLVRRIVKEYHKGKVFVLESQLEIGTTFRISLPK
jgi:signal transduction histidine kinase